MFSLLLYGLYGAAVWRENWNKNRRRWIKNNNRTEGNAFPALAVPKPPCTRRLGASRLREASASVTPILYDIKRSVFLEGSKERIRVRHFCPVAWRQAIGMYERGTPDPPGNLCISYRDRLQATLRIPFGRSRWSGRASRPTALSDYSNSIGLLNNLAYPAQRSPIDRSVRPCVHCRQVPWNYIGTGSKCLLRPISDDRN